MVLDGIDSEQDALQILILLLERSTDDSIEIAVGFTLEVGAFLQENSPKANATVFERFRPACNGPMRSQAQRRAIAMMTMEVRSRIHSLLHSLSMFQPLPRRRVSKTTPKRIS